MKHFLISILLGAIGFLISITYLMLSKDFESYFYFLALILPVTGVLLGFTFFSKNKGKVPFLKQLAYIIAGALFFTMTVNFSFILESREFNKKRLQGATLLQNITNPSSLPLLIRKTPKGSIVKQFSWGGCLAEFLFGAFFLWFLISIFSGAFEQNKKEKEFAKFIEESPPPTFPCVICKETAFIQSYVHRLFYTIGVISAGRNFVFYLPFCETCLKRLNSEKFAVAVFFLIPFCTAITIFSFFAFSSYFPGAVSLLAIVVNGILAFYLYRLIKQKENKYCKFRIDSVNERTGDMKYSVFNSNEETWISNNYGIPEEYIAWVNKEMS